MAMCSRLPKPDKVETEASHVSSNRRPLGRIAAPASCRCHVDDHSARHSAKVNMQSIKGVNAAPAAADFDFNKELASEESGRAAGAAGCREHRAHAVDACQALARGAV